MKKITKMMLALALVAVAAGAYAFTLPGNDKVKVKIVRIVDGDTTITEKVVEESELDQINKEMNDIKGKNVKVMMYVNSLDADKDKKNVKDKEEKMEMSKTFSFDIDSLMKSCKIEINIDSVMKEVANGFNFTVITDDDSKDGDKNMKKVIVKKSGASSYSFSTDSSNVVNISEDNDGDGKTSTIIITTPGDKDGKKVIVKSSVIVIDDKNKSDKKNKKEKKVIRVEDGDKDELKFFPNPSDDGKFTIEYELKGKEPATLTITDANGKQLYKEVIKSEGKYSRQIDLGNKGKGVFILNLQQGKKSISQKLIIE